MLFISLVMNSIVVTMDIALAVSSQVAIMFLLMAVGILCYKIKMLGEHTAAQLSEILLFVVTPAVIVRAFQMDYDPNLASGLLLAAALAVGCQVIGIIASQLLIRRSGKDKTYLSERFGVIYSNCGFLGIPLCAAAFGDLGVVYCSVFLAVFNLFTWTHGITMMSSQKFTPQSIKKVLCSAPLIGIVVGLLLFFTSVKLPNALGEAVGYVADLNTPLAMLVTGSYIARTKLLDAVRDVRLYQLSAIRLLLIPGIFAVFLMFFPVDKTIAMSIMIPAACPVGATTMMLAAKYNANAEHASKMIALSTILSIATIPLMVSFLTLTMGCFSVLS